MQIARFADKFRHSRQHMAEMGQCRPDGDAARAHRDLPDGSFVMTVAFLEHRDAPSDLADRFEVAHQHHGIGDVAGVGIQNIRFQSADPMRRFDQQGQRACLAQISQQFMQLTMLY